MRIYRTDLEKMKELIAQLKKADIAYYRDDAPVISDREYDAFMDELKSLEASVGLTLSGSPTQKVSGEILEELTPVRHSKPMLSADKTKSINDLIRFADGMNVVISWKMDGLTLVLRYKNGSLEQAITRGREGIIGEDVTHTVRTFLNVPLTVPTKKPFEVRGEGVISWVNFDKINLSIEEPYTHPRNLASGSVRKLDPSESKKRLLEFFAFELVTDMRIATKSEQLAFLEENGFTVVDHKQLIRADAESVRAAVKEFDPKDYSYPADGLILEYDNVEYGRSLGSTGHHENRMLALKWQDELYETRFLKLDIAVTRTGMVSLTGIFEPVMIEGTRVSRAYLHNYDIFKQLALGKGDRIRVYKANMIIPQIAENLTKSGSCIIPGNCPCCGKPLVLRSTSGGTKQLFCENELCTARLVQKFVHFCDKSRMNIEGLSEATLEKFIGHGWIHSFGDLYELEKYREDIVQTAGFGDRSFERLQASIDKSRNCSLAKFIAGMGIPMVGRHAGRSIDAYFHGSWDEFEAAIQEGFDFRQLTDFGETMHNNIYSWYSDRGEERLWRPLLNKINFIKEDSVMGIQKITPFFGKTVVATGKLENYTRDGIQTKLIELGARPSGSVTTKTDYLIVGDKAGSKLDKALKLGIKTLTEQEFEEMLA